MFLYYIQKNVANMVATKAGENLKRHSSLWSDYRAAKPVPTFAGNPQKFNFTSLFFADLVTMAKRPEHDPIPNSNVKCFSADGTLS